MTTKEAGEIFGYSSKAMEEMCRSNFIPDAKKVSRKWMIPDDLMVILDKEKCKEVLIEILKLKNYGNGYPVNRRLLPDDERCGIVLDYLYRLGLVGEYDRKAPICLQDICITDEGLKMVLQITAKKEKEAPQIIINFRTQVTGIGINM